jgi:class 3 adenylate cyclase
VVGSKYPRFRLMGDTVNTASRMSTTCLPSQIQLSEVTYRLLPDEDFACLHNGVKLVKGKGHMETYLLCNRKRGAEGLGSALRLESIVPMQEVPADSALAADASSSPPPFHEPPPSATTPSLPSSPSLSTTYHLATPLSSIVSFRSSTAAGPPRRPRCCAGCRLFCGYRSSRLESAFQRDWAERRVGSMRFGLILLTLCQLYLSSPEAYVAWLQRSGGCAQNCLPADEVTTLLSLRFVSLLPIVVTFVLTVPLCTRRLFIRWQQWLLLLCCSACVAVQVVAWSEYYRHQWLAGMELPIHAPIIASFFLGLRLWTVWLCVLWVLLLGGVSMVSLPVPPQLALVQFLVVASILLLCVVSAYVTERLHRLLFVRHAALLSEERRTRDLMAAMLPASVMAMVVRRQLLLGGPTAAVPLVAHHIDNASLLFCDIVGFTALASVLPTADVVALLNAIFTTFDHLTTRFDVYKVDTIGDCYFACSGVVSRRVDHSVQLVRCAVQFELAAERVIASNGKRLSVRCGIHTGSVVAGVVGRKMPRYHLFGAAVSAAEAIEQSGIPDAVVISHATYIAVQRSFDCVRITPPTESAAREQTMDTWRVVRYTASDRTSRKEEEEGAEQSSDDDDSKEMEAEVWAGRDYR